MVESLKQGKLSKEQIEALEGGYDEDGFYLLKDGSFYDPLGYYFNIDGFDETGGRYNDSGVYIKAPTIP